MKVEPAPGKNKLPEAPRHSFGLRPIGALMPALTRPAFRKRNPATANLAADWAMIVGPVLATMTRPQRLVGGTLTLGCIGPVALELQHESAVLIERINIYIGRAVVLRLRFVQEARVVAINGLDRRPRQRIEPVPVDGVCPGPLRDALAALGAAVLADRA